MRIPTLNPLRSALLAICLLGGAVASPAVADRVLDPNNPPLATPCDGGRELKRYINEFLTGVNPDPVIVLLPKAGDPAWTYRICDADVAVASETGLPVLNVAGGGGALEIRSNDPNAGVVVERNPAAITEFRILHVQNGFSLTLRNLTFRNGVAQGGGAVLFESGSAANPGVLELNNCRFRNNTSSASGGAVSAISSDSASAPRVVVTRTVFQGNTARTLGGGLHVIQMRLDLIGGQFLDNAATGNTSSKGGGLFYNEAFFTGAPGENTLTVTAPGGAPDEFPLFRRNSTTGDGGGMYINGGSGPVPVRVRLFSNTARQGGALFNDASALNFIFCEMGADGDSPSDDDALPDGNTALNGGGIFTVDSLSKYVKCKIVSNTSTANSATDALSGGGGVYVASRRPVFVECCIRNNTSLRSAGGGAFLTGKPGEPSFIDCAFTGNRARFGGAIGIDNARPFVFNCYLTGNSASQKGGGIWGTAVRGTKILHSTIARNLAAADPDGGATPVTAGTGLHLEQLDLSNPLEVLNSVFWANARGPGVFTNGSYSFSIAVPANYPPTRFSLIDNRPSPTPFPDPTNSGSNINADPLFVSGAGNDIHLQPASPAIDRASRAEATALITALSASGRLPAVDLPGEYVDPTVYLGDFDDRAPAAPDPLRDETCPEVPRDQTQPTTPRLFPFLGFPPTLGTPPGCEADMGADETPVEIRLVGPENREVCIGGDQCFDVSATLFLNGQALPGGVFDFIWCFNNQPVTVGVTSTDTTSRLCITNAQPAQAGAYTVKAFRRGTIFTSPVTCATQPSVGCLAMSMANLLIHPPQDVSDPGDKVACIGGRQVFEACPVTVPPGCTPTYTWFKVGSTTPITTGGRFTVQTFTEGTPARTCSRLIITAIEAGDTADYRVCMDCPERIDTKCEPDCEDFRLTAVPPPTIGPVPPVTVCRGSDVSVTVPFVAPPACNQAFTWCKVTATGCDPFVPLPTSNVLSFTNIQTAQAGTYRVCVGCPGIPGTKCAMPCTDIVITVIEPPTIVTPPVSRNVCVGGSQCFEVTASFPAGCTPEFIWQKNGVTIADPRFTVAPIAGLPPGQSGSRLCLANAQQGDDTVASGVYRVVVRCAGLATGLCEVVREFDIDVVNPIVYRTLPGDKRACVGGTQTFTVCADFPVTSFQPSCAPQFEWKKGAVVITNGGLGGRATIVNNGDCSTLTITGATAGDSGGYTVQARCADPAYATKCPVAPTPFTFTVINDPDGSNPGNKVVCLGAQQCFSTTVTADPLCPPVVRWFRGNQQLTDQGPSGRIRISSVGNVHTLCIFQAQAGDDTFDNVSADARYRVTIECDGFPAEKGCRDEEFFELNVITPPTLTGVPTSSTYCECPAGDTCPAITFTVTPVNDPGCDPVIRWFKDGTTAPIATGPTLTFPRIALSDAGNYRVCIDCGNLTGTLGGTPFDKCEERCYPFTITVRPKPELRADDGAACPGETAEICARVTRGEIPTSVPCRWFRDGVPLSDGPKYSGTTTRCLSVLDFQLADSVRPDGPMRVYQFRCEDGARPEFCGPIFSNNATIRLRTPDECDCCWCQPDYDGENGQASMIPVRNEFPAVKAANDFYLDAGEVHRMKSFSGTIITNHNEFLPPKARLELYEDCNGCPGALIETYPSTRATRRPQLQDGLKVYDFEFEVPEDEPLWLRGGRTYWISIQAIGDGSPFFEAFWGTTFSGDKILGSVPKKMTATVEGPIWEPLDDCCIGCTELAFCVDCEACPIYHDNGEPPPHGVAAAGTRSERSTSSQRNSRAADDFVVKPCDDLQVCYIEGYIYTNCTGFAVWLEIYANLCDEPVYAFGRPADIVYQRLADKITDLGYDVQIDGVTLSAYKVEFYPEPETAFPQGLVLAGGRNYWLSLAIQDTFSIQERGYFAAARTDCTDCDGRFNEGQTIAPGRNILRWTGAGHDFAFMIAGNRLSDDPMSFPGGGTGGGDSIVTCPTDLDSDGTITVTDLMVFLSNWFAGCP